MLFVRLQALSLVRPQSNCPLDLPFHYLPIVGDHAGVGLVVVDEDVVEGEREARGDTCGDGFEHQSDGLGIVEVGGEQVDDDRVARRIRCRRMAQNTELCMRPPNS